jgi:pyruvate dehydrogenase E1 component beta subunit
MPEMNMVEAIREALKLEMHRDERVIVLGEDVGHFGGVFRATDGLQQQFGSKRVVDTPLAEAVIAGSALGLAFSGLVPVAEMQFLPFSHQAFHQISQQIARTRFRSAGSHPAQITIRAPFGGGVKTPELHSDSIEAQFVQSPGLKIALPSNPYDAKGLLLEAIRDPDPVMFLEPLKGYRLITGEVPDGDYTVPFGKLRVAREGTDVTLIAWSVSVSLAEEAADVLAERGISAHVVDLRTLVPLDIDGLVEAAEKTGRVVVVQEAPESASFGAEVVALIQEMAFYSLEAPIARVSAPDVPYPLHALEEHYIPSVDQVVSTVERTLNGS